MLIILNYHFESGIITDIYITTVHRLNQKNTSFKMKRILPAGFEDDDSDGSDDDIMPLPRCSTKSKAQLTCQLSDKKRSLSSKDKVCK